MLPSVPTRTEFTIRLRDYATWDRLRYEDLIYNNVIRVPSSQILEDFQERLQRRRYIGNSVAGVRTVLLCCRPPDLRCSRNMRRSRTLCNAG